MASAHLVAAADTHRPLPNRAVVGRRALHLRLDRVYSTTSPRARTRQPPYSLTAGANKIRAVHTLWNTKTHRVGIFGLITAFGLIISGGILWLRPTVFNLGGCSR